MTGSNRSLDCDGFPSMAASFLSKKYHSDITEMIYGTFSIKVTHCFMQYKDNLTTNLRLNARTTTYVRHYTRTTTYVRPCIKDHTSCLTLHYRLHKRQHVEMSVIKLQTNSILILETTKTDGPYN